MQENFCFVCVYVYVRVYSVLPGNLHKHGGGAAQATMNTVKCHRCTVT